MLIVMSFKIISLRKLCSLVSSAVKNISFAAENMREQSFTQRPQ
jgi:hypothetical protein